MSINLADYSFDGPYGSTQQLEDRAGVYAILAATEPNRYRVVDVGESAAVRSRVAYHDRALQWRAAAGGAGLFCAVRYTPGRQQATRTLLEQAVRTHYRPLPCGER